MANRTVKDAHSVKGTNPQYLVEKITRTRIYESKYWKEECFALSAELLVDKAMELKFIGGIYGGNLKPTPFLCLILKMLQIQPDKDIIIEFIKNEDFKYVRALGALYMRMVGTSLDCYKYIEPLYLDYRKLRRMKSDGEFEMLHIDEFIDEVLREERVCDIIMPRIQKRQVLEETNQLEPRISALDDDLEEMEEEEVDFDYAKEVERKSSYDQGGGHHDWDKPRQSPSPRHRRSRSRSPRNKGSNRDRERDRDRDRGRHRDRDRRDRDKPRKRSRSRERKSGHRHRHGDDDRHRHHKSKKSKRDRGSSRDRDERKKSSKSSKEEQEIADANAMRAKLGLPPLRP